MSDPIINAGNPHRIAQLTAANAATDAELAPVDPALAPAAGGWQPTFGQRIALTVGAGILGSSAPAILVAIPGPLGMILAAVLAGAATGMGALVGMQSAGPRKL